MVALYLFIGFCFGNIFQIIVRHYTDKRKEKMRKEILEGINAAYQKYYEEHD